MSLYLRNFMRHRNVHIEFGGGTNAIVGSNNSGKTTIIRALRFLAFNFPLGRDRIITRGEKVCEVDALFTGGLQISRKIGLDLNEFKSKDVVLQNPTPDAIQTQITPILAEVGLAPMTFRKKSMWPQFQVSGQYFLVDDTPQGVSSTLSMYSGSDVFAESMKVARKSVVEMTNEMNLCERRVAESKIRLGELEGIIDIASTHMEEIELLVQNSEELHNKIRELERVISESRDSQSLVNSGLDLSRAEDLKRQLSDAVSSMSLISRKIEDISSTLGIVRDLSREVISRREEKEASENKLVETRASLVGRVCPLCGSRNIAPKKA